MIALTLDTLVDHILEVWDAPASDSSPFDSSQGLSQSSSGVGAGASH